MDSRNALAERAAVLPAAFTGWHAATLAVLFVGYAGYYVCRANLPVVGYEKLGLSKGELGDIFSAGVLFYAIGKIVNGLAADRIGGRTLFLLGMWLSIAATVTFGFGNGWWLFASVWSFNRFVQSMGWGGLVQVCSRWFHQRTLATVMGVLSVSFLLGDAAARYYLGWLMSEGIGWRQLFFVSAATLGIIAVICSITLKPSPREVGLSEPAPPRSSVFAATEGNSGQPVTFVGLLGPLFSSTTFWLVCALSLGMTTMREAFGNWTPAFLHEAVGMSDSEAAKASSMFPLVGAAASICAGWASDRIGGRYERIIVPSLLLLTGALMALALMPVRGQPVLALLLISAASFGLIGPYSFCAGVLSLSLGGQRGSATAAGLIDSAGYFGAVFAGAGLGRIIEFYDWRAAFLSLAGVAFLTTIVAVGYWLGQHRAMQTSMGSADK